MQLFALNSSKIFGDCVSSALGLPLAEHEEREFDDGEHKTRPLESVRGRDVFVLQSLFADTEQSVNDKICRLLFFLGAVRDGGAHRVTAIIPYLAYARKDRQTKTRDPVTTRYMAELLESMGIDGVVAVDVHNIVAFQNAFRCKSYHIDTRQLFATDLLDELGRARVVVASPDPGGVKRAQLFAENLQAQLGQQVGFAFIEKRRSAGVVSGARLVGEVENAKVIVVDDLISSGGTMARAAASCLERGAAEVNAVAAHGLFVSDASTTIAKSNISKLFITDTINPFRLDQQVLHDRVKIVSAAPLLAQAIRRIHEGSSLTELLEGEA